MGNLTANHDHMGIGAMGVHLAEAMGNVTLLGRKLQKLRKHTAEGIPIGDIKIHQSIDLFVSPKHMVVNIQLDKGR